VSIAVKDTGIGISEEFLPRIFNSFEQESTGRSRSHEGSGLGLAISKKYIELLGGEILIESKKDHGSTFEIVLPAYKGNEENIIR
jgi:signal transduction histidine kinase